MGTAGGAAGAVGALIAVYAVRKHMQRRRAQTVMNARAGLELAPPESLGISVFTSERNMTITNPMYVGHSNKTNALYRETSMSAFIACVETETRTTAAESVVYTPDEIALVMLADDETLTHAREANADVYDDARVCNTSEVAPSTASGVALRSANDARPNVAHQRSSVVGDAVVSTGERDAEVGLAPDVCEVQPATMEELFAETLKGTIRSLRTVHRKSITDTGGTLASRLKLEYQA